MATSAPEAKKDSGATMLIVGLVVIIIATVVVAQIDANIGGWFKAAGISKNVFEYPLTAAIIGILLNFLFRAIGQYEAVKPALKTEFFLKIGLVGLGSKVSLGVIMKAGAGGLVQAVIMVTSVFFFTWWLGNKFKLSETLTAVMATGVSICGVSAAIAAAGSVLAKKEEVSYIATLIILTALPLMVIMPWIANALNLPADVAGAWFGGNIDTTAAVVGAGTIHGPVAQEIAAVVKMSQNVLIGFAAFFLALYFVMVVEKGEGTERPSAMVIWQRFPKFVLGFLLVSIITSLGILRSDSDAGINQPKDVETFAKWLFAAAFVSIGFELSWEDVTKMGWTPVLIYLAATVFNTVLALIISYIIFGMLFPVAPAA